MAAGGSGGACGAEGSLEFDLRELVMMIAMDLAVAFEVIGKIDGYREGRRWRLLLSINPFSPKVLFRTRSAVLEDAVTILVLSSSSKCFSSQNRPRRRCCLRPMQPRNDHQIE